MRGLEEKESQEENIEVAYNKSPEKAINGNQGKASLFNDDILANLLCSKELFRENPQTQF